jgi:hypothetical protein
VGKTYPEMESWLLVNQEVLLSHAKLEETVGCSRGGVRYRKKWKDLQLREEVKRY